MASTQQSGKPAAKGNGGKPAAGPTVSSVAPSAAPAGAQPANDGGKKAKSALALDTTLLPVGFRKAQIAFLDAAAAKVNPPMTRVDFVRRACLAAASSVLAQPEPVCEAFRVGARGSLSGLTDEQRKAVAQASKQAAASARAALIAKLRAA